jgi:hypothetical protein
MFAAAQWEFVGEGIDLMLGRSSISWGTLTLLGTFTLQVRSNFDDSIDLHERLYLCALFALTHHPVMNSSIVSCRRCGNFYYLKGRREY